MHPIRSSSLAAVGWLRAVRPQRSHLRADIVAGLPGAIGSVPDGMAAAILAGVNPVQGMYASFAGPTAGGLTSHTRLMVVTTTSAAALAAGSALHGVPAGGQATSTGRCAGSRPPHSSASPPRRRTTLPRPG